MNNTIIKPNPKLGDEAKSMNQHGDLDDNYAPSDHDSFIECTSSIINDLSSTDYKELFKDIKQRVDSMKKNDKNGLSEVRKIIRHELTKLLEVEIKKVDFKDKMRSVLNMTEDEFDSEYGGVYGADYALENFEDFKKWLSKQSKLDKPTQIGSSGVDVKSAISSFKELPKVKALFNKDMTDAGDKDGDKRDYNKGSASLREIGKLLQDNGVDVDASNPSSVRNYLGRKIDMPIIKKAMERTGKKYKIDMIKLVFDPGFTSWLSSRYKLHHEDKQKDWELFLYNVVGKKLHKEITTGELKRFNAPNMKSKINTALHQYKNVDSELKETFDEEYSAYFTEVNPDEFDSNEFLHNWFLNDADDNKQRNDLALNGAYETIVDMLDDDSDDDSDDKKNKKNLSESYSRITEKEMSEWKKGNWGYVFEAGDASGEDMPEDYEQCGTCGYDHDYDFPTLSREEMETAKQLHSGDKKNKKENFSENIYESLKRKKMVLR